MNGTHWAPVDGSASFLVYMCTSVSGCPPPQCSPRTLAPVQLTRSSLHQLHSPFYFVFPMSVDSSKLGRLVLLSGGGKGTGPCPCVRFVVPLPAGEPDPAPPAALVSLMSSCSFLSWAPGRACGCESSAGPPQPGFGWGGWSILLL